MLTWLTEHLSHYYGFFRVFDYITFRCILAVISALIFSLFLAPPVIRKLAAQKVGQMIRDDGPQSHLSKAGTPTMGGILIIFSVTITTLLWGNLTNRFVLICLFSLLSFGLIGGIDDYRKLVLKHSRGLPARWKYFWQSVFGLFIVGFLYFSAQSSVETTLYFPFFKELFIPLGWFYLVWGYFVIVGSSNAVNLTDGLDGLAIMPTVMVAGALAIFAYVTGHVQFSHYLAIPHIPGTGEIAVFCAALVGAGLGFLWFNTYPAQVFMGDIGSLGLGASLGCIALMVRQELVLAMMGGIFVLETISVVVQVASFKLTGQRVFRMAPLHHHYELKGWPEPRVIVRFWIISFILVLFGLATLKLR